jgi:acetolactate synthase-1/2/3 large subunit
VSTAAEEVAKNLKTLGVRQVFTLCADQTNGLLNALAAEDIRIVGARHESAAVLMADGWSRATGEIGVAIVGGGPGFVNSVTGFAVSQSAATPVVVISGIPPVHTRERNGHQILYQADIVRSLTKWSQEVVHSDITGEFLSRGFAIAAAGKPGPVNLSIPVGVLDGDASGSVYKTVPACGRSTLQKAGEREISRASTLLNEARRPIIIVGGGAWWELGGTVLRGLAQKLEIPVFTTELARGLIADDGTLCFGYAHPSFNRAFHEIRSADLLLLVGTEINLHTGNPEKSLIAKDAKIIQLHRDPAQIGIGRATDAALLGSLEYSLAQLADAIEPSTAIRRKQWLDHVRGVYTEHRSRWQKLGKQIGKDESSIHPLLVCESLQRHYSEAIRVVIDGGDFVHWPRLYFEAKSPGYWMDGAEIGALGASLPVGIGAQLGSPAKQTWVFLGDGGFGFYGFDLSTAVQNNVAVKVIVGNDRCWGVERRLQRARYGSTVATDLPDIDYGALARTLGAKGLSVSDPRYLDEAVDELVSSDGPCVLNIAIAPDAGRPVMN